MPLNTITLHWDLTDLIQAGLSATLSITPTAQMSDATDHILIPPVARTYTFSGGSGQLAGIVANDNSAILPAGTGYLISVTAGNGVVIVPQFQTRLLFSNGADQWLDTLATVPVVTTSYQYLPLPSGTPTAGQVPVATGSGEASAWGAGGGGGAVSSVFTRTGAVTAQTGDYTAAQVTNAADKSSGTTQAFTGNVSAPAFAATGLTGATAASRYAGATASGAPASGTFSVGDFVIDQAGKVWICTTAGSPGTWTAAGPTIPVTIAQGGTGQTTQQAALDALAGAVTNNQVLAGNGTHVTLRALASGDIPDLAYVDSVTAADTSVVIGGAADTPTVRTNTLDVIATQHPAAADWSNNSHKITSLANGSGAQDAAAYGQTPAGGNTVTIAQGGTGQVTQQAAIDALAGAQTSAQFLRGNGTHVQMSAIQAGDVPDLAYVDSVTAADSSITVTGAADTPAVSSVPAQLVQRMLCV